MATAWFDERLPRHGLHRPRSVGRPLWLGEGRHEAFFASTKDALEVTERYLGLKLKKRELPEGIVVALDRRQARRATRFNPDRAFEEESLPAVRSPHEGATCLRRLAAIAARLSEPSGDTSIPSSSSRSRTRYWNVAQAPTRRRRPEEPVSASPARAANAPPPGSSIR